MSGASDEPMGGQVLRASAVNPYIGPRAFEARESAYFCGRDREVEILTATVMARRAALLFAQSGAGKTSLLQAGLIPELTRLEVIGRGARARSHQKMQVLPVLTVGGALPIAAAASPPNVYVCAALFSLFPDAATGDLAHLTLTDGLAQYGAEASVSLAEASLLIFDQFEELFTRAPAVRSEQEAFFLQLREALHRYPALHALFAMREDHIGELTPYASLLPDGLRHRFRLERLDRDAALEAVRRPAERAGCPFGEDVAEALVDNLRGAQGQVRASALHGAGRVAERPSFSEYVEPVHLQIVCHQLWDNLPPGRTTVLAEDLREFGDVDEALTAFYENGLLGAAEATGVSERRLRTWFDDALITPARTRGLAYRDTEDTAELPNAAVDVLREGYIVRTYTRGADTWCELAHDRLVEPILATNQAWYARHRNPLTLAAEAWLQGGKAQDELYSGAQLQKALAQVEAEPEEFSDLEREFVRSSAEAARRHVVRRQRVLLLAAVVLLLVFSGLTSWSLVNARRATDAMETAIAEKNIRDDLADGLAFALTAQAVQQVGPQTTETASTDDADGDGLSDRQEELYGTNPWEADTDGDGLNDGDEIRFNTDPLAIDTDRDTLLDGAEVHKLGTSPTNPDTDGDGLNDNVDPDPGALPTPLPTPTPTIPPVLRTPTKTRIVGPTPDPTDVASAATATPNLEGTATIKAIQTRLAEVQALQTTEANAVQVAPMLAAVLDDHGSRMLLVPAGRFIMGSEAGGEDERPAHKVELGAFYIDQHEVTNEQYAAFLRDLGTETEAKEWLDGPITAAGLRRDGESWRAVDGYADHPVVGVTWYGAAAYCKWAGKRLPSEAEWEKAARGSDALVYPWGDKFDGARLNYCDASCELRWRDERGVDGYPQTAPVGSFPKGASPYGALDMAGNVWEWVADWYDADYYQQSPVTDPVGPAAGGERVHRGGSWDSTEEFSRAALRYHVPPAHAAPTLGFRCAQTP